MIRLLRTLFGIYALLMFPVTLIITTILYVIIFTVFSEKRSPHIAHGLSRIWARVLTIIFFVPERIANKHLIDPKKTYVFVANHQSQLDIPVYALACKNTIRFLAKAELTKIPLMGYIIRKLYLTVNRTDRHDRNRSIEIMRKSLDEGISVFLCPEGTRNRHEEPALLDFRDGAFRLAIATKTPIAALTLLNTGRKLSPLHPIALAPGIIHGVWDEPIDTSGMTMEDVPTLKEKVRASMEKHLREYREKSPRAR
ncbi:MAG TPA: lysophospholipid acyltransferase family protein [Bacteroidia bacterium]|nr:lysophospholipid acyltransferase family protein [Bacteroidia bacterium]